MPWYAFHLRLTPLLEESLTVALQISRLWVHAGWGWRGGRGPMGRRRTVDGRSPPLVFLNTKWVKANPDEIVPPRYCENGRRTVVL